MDEGNRAAARALPEFVERLRALATTLSKAGDGDFYLVDNVWLPRGAQPYVISGSNDPHLGKYVCDFVEQDQAASEDEYSEDEWEARNWSLAEYVAAASPNAVLTLIESLSASMAPQRQPGTLEVCERYVFHDCINYRGHIQWKHGAGKCTYGSCPRRNAAPTADGARAAADPAPTTAGKE